MFFALSKVLAFFLIPSNLVVVLGAAGVMLLPTRFTRAGQRLMVASILITLAVAVIPVGTALLLVLEQRFPTWSQGEGKAPDGIVLLGGALEGKRTQARGIVQVNDSAARLTGVAALARRYPDARIVYSGGNGHLLTPGPAEAEFAIQLFDSLGIASNRVMLEERSRNTAENAHFSKAMVDPKPGERWLLATSATHMPRAIGAFRNVGFDVEAVPVAFLTAGPQDLWRLHDSLGHGWRELDAAVREYIGLFAYWISGRTPELFPGPGRADTRP